MAEREARARQLAAGGVPRHLAVLEAAGLAETRREGRCEYHDLNTAPPRLIVERRLVPRTPGPEENTP